MKRVLCACICGLSVVAADAHLLERSGSSSSPQLLAYERRRIPPEQEQWRSGGASPTNHISIVVEGNYRVIRGNGIPDHTPGTFPNRHNPNRLAAQNYHFRVPLHPKVAPRPTPIGMQPFGIAVNGVMFDPAAAEWWQGNRGSGWQYEPMLLPGRLGADIHHAHVQPDGTYHYHSVPTGLLELRGGSSNATLIGWAADGFPIYGPSGYTDANNTNSPIKKLTSSYRVKKGNRPNGPGGKYDGTFVADYEFIAGAGDLDECNGRYGVTPEFPQGTYYYVVTEEFPFIPRLFKGTPDPSFPRKGPPGGRRPHPGQPGPPEA